MSKLINILFFGLILLLPSQLGKHWWPEWSLVNGVRVDYLAPTIFLTDIVLGILLVSYFLREKSKIKNQKSKIQIKNQKFVKTIFVLAVGYLLFIVLSSPRPWLAGYWVARYLEIGAVAWVTAKMVEGRRKKEEGRRRLILPAMSVGIIFSFVLGLTQMILGGTTGWFWWLGERTFTAATPGVATLTIFGREILRPYATFPHPNALGGFVAAATLLLLQVKSEKLKVKSLLVALIGTIGVILTGSRGALAALAAAALLKVKSSVVILGVLGGLGILGLSGNTVRFANESGEERIALVQSAIKMWQDNWLMGVGPGQFLVRMPEYLPGGFYKIQPVHNVFLLGLTEFGVGGGLIWLIGLICLIWQIKRNKQVGKWMPALAVIFVTGMVDHYWLTAQQNRLLLGMILGLMVSAWGRRSVCDNDLRLRSK